jgi:NAD(P)-dependent dehydrogenase (short-subunit alcohol dehydrogenase family)
VIEREASEQESSSSATTEKDNDPQPRRQDRRYHRGHGRNWVGCGKAIRQGGAYVFITGRRQKELDEAVKAIGSNVSGVQGDVAKLTDLDRLYETVSKVKGRIDIVFANAGVGEFVPFGAVTEEHFDKLFNINVRGTLFTVQKHPTCGYRPVNGG